MICLLLSEIVCSGALGPFGMLRAVLLTLLELFWGHQEPFWASEYLKNPFNFSLTPFWVSESIFGSLLGRPRLNFGALAYTPRYFYDFRLETFLGTFCTNMTPKCIQKGP